ncbi:MAG: Tol-Pal system beta propeller repeat protein TolB [Candidatus Binatia bacterium]
MRRIFGLSLAVALALAASPATAQVTGRIVGPGATRIELAVSPLAGDGEAANLGRRFSEIVAKNLALSGYFKILDSKAYVEGPMPIDLDKIDFGSWRLIGARALVKGTLQSSGSEVVVEARLFDVAQQQQLGGQRFHAPSSDLPRLARRFADEVMRYLTGEPGPFDSRIAFASRRGGRSKEIHLMSVDGIDTTGVTKNRTINLAPSWNPDGGSILFTSFQGRGGADLYRYDLGSKNERRITSGGGGLNLGGRFSPDGGKIAISIERNGNSEIALIEPSGQLIKRLTNSPEIDVSPTWSPDGSKIAFVSARTGNPQIYVMGADGSGVRRLTYQGSYNTSPSWSPKGDLIAYVSRDQGFNVFTVDVASGKASQVTSGQGNNEDPSFSPDGRYVVFSSTRVGRPSLFLSDVSGSHQVQLTETGGDDTSPSWSPRLQ